MADEIDSENVGKHPAPSDFKEMLATVRVSFMFGYFVPTVLPKKVNSATPGVMPFGEPRMTRRVRVPVSVCIRGSR
jgi:hypothetical protein